MVAVVAVGVVVALVVAVVVAVVKTQSLKTPDAKLAMTCDVIGTLRCAQLSA